jgi:hypothetical protein
MKLSKLTPTRIVKALKHRVRKVRTAPAKIVSPAKSFSSPTALREFALETQNSGVAFQYEIALPANFQLLSLEIKIGQLEEVETSLKKSKLHVYAKFSNQINEGYFAWAVARMISPALSPNSAMSKDIKAGSTTAAGTKVVLGPVPQTDAADMEIQHIEIANPNTAEFDLALFNPIGLRLRKLLESPQIAKIQIANDLKLNGSPRILDEHFVSDLRKYVGAEVEVSDEANVSIFSALAATGLVMHTNKEVTTLNPELASLLSQGLPVANSSNQLEWLFRSESQRRLAMLHHSNVLSKINSWPEVTILLVTNRLNMVARALEQIAAQTYPNFEVQLALHGISEAEAAFEISKAHNLLADRLHVNYVEQNKNLGEIYGELTQTSQSEFLAKFDDDDLYGPNHLWDAIISMKYSGAGLFGRTPQLTWLETTGELLLRPFGDDEIYNKYIIGPTMVMNRAALLEVGGWRPTPWAVDKALIDRFQQFGGGIYRAGGFGWVYVRHDQGHTWLKDESHFRNQAEQIWSGPEALAIKNRALS